AAAVRAPSFRAAAQRVALTPAALGQRIQKLEDSLGVVLFERTTRRITPTAAALMLAPPAERCLRAPRARVRTAPGRAQPAARAATELVMGARYELGESWLVPQLATLRRTTPWLRLHLYFGSGSDLLARVRAADIDCAITSTRFADPQLDALVIHEEEYVF